MVVPLPARPGRPHVLTQVLAAMAAAAVVVLPAAAARAEPSAADVRKQIDAAWQKLEPVIEQYNKVRSELAANQKRSLELSQKIEPLGRTVELTRARVQEIAANSYRRAYPLSTFDALLSSGSPTVVAEQLALLDRLADSERQQINALSAQQAQYDAQKEIIDALIVTQERQRSELAAKKVAIDAEIKRLEALHEQIAAAEAAAAAKAAAAAEAARAAAAAQAAATADATSPIKSASPLFIGGQCPALPTTGDGGIAAKTACLQIGKPYVWAANGPGTSTAPG